MKSCSLLPLIAVGAAIAPVSLFAAVPTADPNRCALLADLPSPSTGKAAAGHRALMGFARGLAGNLPMLGGRGAGASLATRLAGQAASAALNDQPAAPRPTALPADCAGSSSLYSNTAASCLPPPSASASRP